MPYKPKRPCSYPGCPKLCNGSYCAEHQKAANRNYNKYERDPECNKRYGSEWRKIRNRYVKLHPLCEECLKYGRLVPAEEVHHILPLADGGSNDFCNLCKSCHSAITLAANNKKRG